MRVYISRSLPVNWSLRKNFFLLSLFFTSFIINLFLFHCRCLYFQCYLVLNQLNWIIFLRYWFTFNIYCVYIFFFSKYTSTLCSLNSRTLFKVSTTFLANLDIDFVMIISIHHLKHHLTFFEILFYVLLVFVLVFNYTLFFNNSVAF